MTLTIRGTNGGDDPDPNPRIDHKGKWRIYSARYDGTSRTSGVTDVRSTASVTLVQYLPLLRR